MNPNNGLLMCPICDKLFENSNYITISSTTGDVKYSAMVAEEKDFQYLKGKTLSINYVDCERKHYLKWHNDEFDRKHSSDLPPASTIVVGLSVSHDKFGYGVIQKIEDGYVYVMFGREEKKFQYPSIFESKKLILK